MSHLRKLLGGLTSLDIPGPIPTSVSAQDFPLFPTLPTEMRHKIWKFACLNPRYIRLSLYQHETSNAHEPAGIEGQSRAPVVLHVNRESRKEAMRYYYVVLERPRFKELPYYFQAMPLARGQFLVRDFSGNIEHRANRLRQPLMRMKSNMVFVNFDVDIFLQDAMPDRRRPICIFDYNYEPHVLRKIVNLETVHYHILSQFDFDNLTCILSAARPDRFVVNVLSWLPDHQVGFEETFDAHLHMKEVEAAVEFRMSMVTHRMKIPRPSQFITQLYHGAWQKTEPELPPLNQEELDFETQASALGQ